MIPNDANPKRKLHDTLDHVVKTMADLAKLHELLTRCAQYRERRDA